MADPNENLQIMTIARLRRRDEFFTKTGGNKKSFHFRFQEVLLQDHQFQAGLKVVSREINWYRKGGEGIQGFFLWNSSSYLRSADQNNCGVGVREVGYLFDFKYKPSRWLMKGSDHKLCTVAHRLKAFKAGHVKIPVTLSWSVNFTVHVGSQRPFEKVSSNLFFHYFVGDIWKFWHILDHVLLWFCKDVLSHKPM